MTAQTRATAEMEKWLRFRVRFFTNFWLRGRIRSERKTQNLAGVDSGNPFLEAVTVWGFIGTSFVCNENNIAESCVM